MFKQVFFKKSLRAEGEAISKTRLLHPRFTRVRNDVLSFIFCFSIATFSSYAQDEATESDQQISDFSLAGYGEQGKKTWELSGKSADIFDEVVKLKDITGNLYGKDEDIKLTSDKGDFNKTEGKIFLEDNVVITTTSGAKLTTDSLEWDRKKQFVSTKDVVNITRDNMFTQATGATGEPNLNKVNLEKNVTVEILPKKEGQPQEQPKDALGKDKIVVTCDGPLEIDYAKNVAVFKNNVKVDREGSQIYCDLMNIHFLKKEDKKEEKEEQPEEGGFMSNTQIDKLVCRGNVRIMRGENVSYSDEAVYTARDRKITLSGRPKLILYSMEEFKSAPIGN